MREQILDSLKSHAIGQINKHKMDIEIYLSNPTGIGEHPDVLEAIEMKLKVVAEYDDQLAMIEKYLK
jgi:hypothetical protein|tara:strand:- start:4853 stop:5053 length:201 start_codon:yes stop_codon:yes gene_type:complete